MLKKRYVKSRKVCKVRFELPKAELPEGVEAETVHLVGDFNGWDTTASPMPPNSKKVYRIELELEPGCEYQFRYLINGEQWCNDWHADAYVPNESGTDNCVVVTPAGA
jgi:1,4-alpha-glucan branching enzyme